jgi:predicted CoA-binding protein
MRVMVIGASQNRAKFGNKAVRAYLRQNHEVIPINPNEEVVEGLPCVATVGAVPGHVDRALFYVQPAIGLKIIDEIAERGDVSEVWLNPGAESGELIRRARKLGIEPILACSIVDIGERP